jgi:hypothetical protein
MGYSTRVASSVLFVAELDRSVNFYWDLFGCVETPRSGEAALLLAPGGFQLYLIERGKRAEHHSGGLGRHLLMWATDTAQGLKYFEQTLKGDGALHGDPPSRRSHFRRRPRPRWLTCHRRPLRPLRKAPFGLRNLYT